MRRDQHWEMKCLMMELKRDEGFRPKPYRCTAGALTIGYGRNLDVKGISQAEADILLRNDIVFAQDNLYAVFPDAFSLNSPRFRVLVNMIFHLGTKGFLGFKRLHAAILARDFNQAADEILDSRAASQCPDRFNRHAETMRTGL